MAVLSTTSAGKSSAADALQSVLQRLGFNMARMRNYLGGSHIKGYMNHMAKNGGKSGWVTTRSLSSGSLVAAKGVAGRVQAHSSFSLPNGDKIGTVRRDIMDRALGRSSEKKD